jgi:hypothetical protein
MTAVINAIDAGAGAGTITVYDGTRPATGASITTQTALVVGTLSDPCGTVTNGVLTFSSITWADVDEDGTATWARVRDSDGNFVLDMSAGDIGDVGTADLVFNSASLVAGSPIEDDGATLTEGNA